MKARIEIGATIPTRQYENIQPRIEIEEVQDIKGALDLGLSYIKDIASQYGQHGALPEPTVEVTEKLKSFNEQLTTVEFDRKRHVFTYQGKVLQGATTYISRFFKKFDAEAVAKNCEKSWGVPAKDIQDMWSSNGSVTAGFGTAVHAALEHYEKHRGTARTIETNKEDGEDRALPKHPILRKIVEDFKKLPQFAGTVWTEALVTDVERGFCGIADRILVTDAIAKTCRIQDYKINVEADKEDKNSKPLKPFDNLPANKLSKYQLQMSFYANLLQKSGWTVQGLDVFVLEDEWKHYELEMLNVI